MCIVPALHVHWKERSLTFEETSRERQKSRRPVTGRTHCTPEFESNRTVEAFCLFRARASARARARFFLLSFPRLCLSRPFPVCRYILRNLHGRKRGALWISRSPDAGCFRVPRRSAGRSRL